MKSHYKILIFFSSFILFTLLTVSTEKEVLAVEGYNATLESSEWITSGAKLESWNLVTPTGKVKIEVIEVDFQNPYIVVDTIFGEDGYTGDKQTINNMARESGAVAAINGDFFTINAEGAPFGVTIQAGKMITSPGYIHSKNAFTIDKFDNLGIDRLDFDAILNTTDGASFQIFGINKTEYQAGYLYSGNSHENRLHMYTDLWNTDNWVGDSLDDYTTVLVENNRVTKIVKNNKVGLIPQGGYVLLGQGEAADFLDQHINLGESLIVEYSLNTNNSLEVALGGSTLLVDNGEKAPITYEIKGNYARTAIGYSKDERYLYLVTVEKSKKSVGMTLDQFSNFLILRGCFEAVNLDGGGSTTMVTRSLGKNALVDAIIPQYGVERQVPNGLAIYSTAPKGSVKNYNIDLPAIVVQDEVIPIELANAYDQFYNPLVLDDIDITWVYPKEVSLSNEGFIFHDSGVFNITAQVGSLSKSYQVKVYDLSDVEQIKIVENNMKIHVGESVSPTVKMYFKDSTVRVVPNALLDWKLVGINGEVSNSGKITGNSSSLGMLVGSYQNFSTSVQVIIGTSSLEKVIDSYNNRGIYLLKKLTGTETSNILISEENNRNIATLTYDFGKSEELRIVYINYGTVGKQVTGDPAILGVDVKGDNSRNWLRTSIRDANGNIHYLTLAEQIDWEGWKTIEVELPSNITVPIYIQNIYVAHLDDTSDKSANNGKISFANLYVKEWLKEVEKVDTSLLFTVGSETVQVGNDQVVLDQAPIIVDGRTYISVRHVSELLGGIVDWNSEEKKIEVQKENQIFEFWLNKKYMNENGVKIELDAEPFVKNGRTMIPLRVLSESYGLYVYYDNKTKTISIH